VKQARSGPTSSHGARRIRRIGSARFGVVCHGMFRNSSLEDFHAVVLVFYYRFSLVSPAHYRSTCHWLDLLKERADLEI